GIAVAARGAVRSDGMSATADGVAAVHGTRIVVVTVERATRVADASSADFHPVARVAVAARGAVRHGGLLAAEQRAAAVHRARVLVVTAERRARPALACLTRLGPVAEIAVRARRTVGHQAVLAAGHGIAGVVRARVTVVAA